jgi:NitT/TauT family transport system substrate-binding protein
MRRLLPSLAALALVASVAGCDGDGPDGSVGNGGGSGSEELRSIRVGTIPIVDTAAIYLGVEQGFFEDRDIDVELISGSGGVTAVPGVISGDYDFAFGNVTSILLAEWQDLPLRIVTNGVATAGDAAGDFSQVMVPADSPILTAADLQGRTVSVNNLENIGEVTIRKAIEDDGGDPFGVTFVEVPFPDMPAALAAGDVDAAWLVEPFVTVAAGQGARSVLAPFAEPIPDLTVAVYFTTEQLIQEDPDLVDDFQAAMGESLAYADDNPDEVRRIILTYTQVPDAAAAEMALPSFPQEVNWDSLQTVADLMAELGITEEAPDVDVLRATD